MTSTDPTQQLLLDFTIQGVSIFYRDKHYRFSGGIGALILAITSDVEKFLTRRGEVKRLAHETGARRIYVQ